MSFTANIDDVVAENRNHLLGKHPKWERVRLKEIATILNGYPFESGRFKRSGGTPLIRIRDILGGRTETFYDGDFDSSFLVKHGEILIGMDGDFHCEPWTGEPALLNQRVCKITPDETRYAKQFLRYLLPGYLSAINAQTPSVTVKHLSSRTIADIPLPLPPLPEQRRIVAEIEKQFTRLEAGLTALRRVAANLKRYRAAVLKAACEGRLVSTEATGWRDATFGEVCRVQCGFAFKSTDYQQSGVPLIRIASLVDSEVTLDGKTAYLPASYVDEYAAFALKKGDVLIAMSGATTGKMATFNLDTPALLNQRVGRFQIKPGNLCNARFMALIVEQIKQQVIRDAYGAAQPNISPKQIEIMPFRLPPLAEQERIVAEVERRLSVVEELEALVESNLKRAARLRQAVLQEAFTGRLVQ